MLPTACLVKLNRKKVKKTKRVGRHLSLHRAHRQTNKSTSTAGDAFLEKKNTGKRKRKKNIPGTAIQTREFLQKKQTHKYTDTNTHQVLPQRGVLVEPRVEQLQQLFAQQPPLNRGRRWRRGICSSALLVRHGVHHEHPQGGLGDEAQLPQTPPPHVPLVVGHDVARANRRVLELERFGAPGGGVTVRFGAEGVVQGIGAIIEVRIGQCKGFRQILCVQYCFRLTPSVPAMLSGRVQQIGPGVPTQRCLLPWAPKSTTNRSNKHQHRSRGQKTRDRERQAT